MRLDAGLQAQLRAWLASDEHHREEYEHLTACGRPPT
jgi:transmembrane sensor